MFNNMTSDGLEKTEDRIGGYSPFESKVYTGTIKVAYGIESRHGAKGVTMILDIDGREFRHTEYVTNRKGENFFLDKNDSSKKIPLPGFTQVNELALLTTGEPLAQQKLENKVVKLYDPEQKQEVPTEVPTLVSLVGKPVRVAIKHNEVNKQVKNSSGDYVDTAEKRSENEVSKFFHVETGMTVNEIRDYKAQAEKNPDNPPEKKAVYLDEWVSKWEGKVDSSRFKQNVSGASGSGRPTGSGSSGETTKSLF